VTAISWDVNNPTTQDFRLGLDEAELVSFLTSIPEAELSQWQVARSDAPDQWMACLDLPALRLISFGFGIIPAELGLSEVQLGWIEAQLRNKVKVPPAAPLVIPSTSHSAPMPPVQAPAAPVQVQNSWVERRKNPRMKLRLQVVLIQGKDAFRTFTRDISLGGMALEKAVPQKMIGSECTIFITDPRSNVKYPFEGRVLPEAPGSNSSKYRLMFAEMGSVSRKALEAWLNQVVSASKKAA